MSAFFDFTFTALVVGLEVTNSLAKAGVAIRDSTDPGARTLYVMSTGSAGAQALYRSAPGGPTQYTDPVPTAARPVWVRVSKVGNVWTGYTSTDGFDWMRVVAVTMATAARSLQVGLVVCSKDHARTATASFTNVQVSMGRRFDMAW